MARNPGSIYLSFVFFTWIMMFGMISANGNYIKGMFNFFGRSNPPAQVSKVTTNLNTTKIGIMLLNLGGPAKIEDVEGFLYNLFSDPDIIRLPKFLSILQKPIAKYIAKTRAPQSSEGYKSIGGGSPIVKYTTEQANGIERALQKRGYNAKSYFAMRYWDPYTSEVLDEVERDKVQVLVVVPLYPHYSVSTSGSSLRVLNEEFNRRREVWGPCGDYPVTPAILHTVVPSWYNRPGYVRTMADLVLAQYRSFTDQARLAGVDILFSAHGVPQQYILGGDPYQRHIEECVKLITTRVGQSLTDLAKSNSTVRYHLCYQSRVGPVEWLRPYTDDAIRSLAKAGSKNLLVVPIAFVSEHIETLEEIDMEYRELALEEGIENWRRAPAVNAVESFIEDMADLVEEALQAPRVSVADAMKACLLPITNSKEVEKNLELSCLLQGSVGTNIAKQRAKEIQRAETLRKGRSTATFLGLGVLGAKAWDLVRSNLQKIQSERENYEGSGMSLWAKMGRYALNGASAD